MWTARGCPASSLKEGLVWGWKRRRSGRKGKGQAARGRGERAPAKGTSLRGRGCTPVPRNGCAQPLGRSALGRGRGRGKRKRRPPPAQLRPSRRASRGCRALSGSGATATAARPVGGRGLRGPPRVPRAGFHAPTAGGASSGWRRPGAGRLRRLPETGRVFQTLLEIHRHLHPASASPRLAGGTGRTEGAAGAAELGTQTDTAGARPRLALRGAAEGASSAGHSSPEDRGGSDC